MRYLLGVFAAILVSGYTTVNHMTRFERQGR